MSTKEKNLASSGLDKNKSIDFGAPDNFGAHLFRVMIPAARNESVVIVEDYGYRGEEGGVPREEERVVLKRPVWSAIAEPAAANSMPAESRQGAGGPLAYRRQSGG